MNDEEEDTPAPPRRNRAKKAAATETKMAYGPETESVLTRDGPRLRLRWVRHGKELSASVYEPQGLEVSPALADALALAFEEGMSTGRVQGAAAAQRADQPSAGPAGAETLELKKKVADLERRVRNLEWRSDPGQMTGYRGGGTTL